MSLRIALMFVLPMGFACKDDGKGSPGGDGPETDSGESEAGFGEIRGRLLSQWGYEIPDVTVEAGGVTTISDNRGLFALEGVPAGSAVNVFARSNGWSTGHSQVTVVADESVQVQLELLSMQSTYFSGAEDGGQFTSWDAVNIDFAEAGLVNPAGNPVTGDITVQTGLINDMSAIGAAPGDMMSLAGGEEVQLETFGMVEIRLVQDEQELQLASPATIEVPLSSVGTPGDSVGLYYFDEAQGRWIEEGTLTLGASSFTAEVSHFSSWNCDQPVETHQCITGRLVDADGGPLPSMNVKLKGVDYGTSSSVPTDADGRFCLAAKVSSTNQLSAFAAEDDSVYSWAQTVTTPSSSAQCGSSGCVDLGDQVAEQEDLTCVSGTVRADHVDKLDMGCPMEIEVRDADGGQVMYQQFHPTSADVCFTVPTGQTIHFKGDANVDNDPTDMEATLTNVDSTCSRGGCQDLGELPLYCDGWGTDEGPVGK